MGKTGTVLIPLFLLVIVSIFATKLATKTAGNALKSNINNYLEAHGVTAVAEGTVCKKQYNAAHTDYHSSLFSQYSQFYPDEWQVDIRRYDTKTKKWETATVDIDKATYNKLKIGEHYKDPLSQTTYFEYDS